MKYISKYIIIAIFLFPVLTNAQSNQLMEQDRLEMIHKIIQMIEDLNNQLEDLKKMERESKDKTNEERIKYKEEEVFRDNSDKVKKCVNDEKNRILNRTGSLKKEDIKEIKNKCSDGDARTGNA